MLKNRLQCLAVLSLDYCLVNLYAIWVCQSIKHFSSKASSVILLAWISTNSDKNRFRKTNIPLPVKSWCYIFSYIYVCFFGELSCRRTVLSVNCSVGKQICRRTILTANCPVGKLSCRKTVRSAKIFPRGDIFWRMKKDKDKSIKFSRLINPKAVIKTLKTS